MSKPITEDDLRQPEFKGVPLSELERDATGAIVLKKPDDRLRRLVAACGFMPDNFDINIVCGEAERADKAHTALNVTYRALRDEQVRLQNIGREQYVASGGAESEASRLTRGRCEGITGAIRILTDAAGRAGYILR